MSHHLTCVIRRLAVVFEVNQVFQTTRSILFGSSRLSVRNADRRFVPCRVFVGGDAVRRFLVEAAVLVRVWLHCVLKSVVPGCGRLAVCLDHLLVSIVLPLQSLLHFITEHTTEGGQAGQGGLTIWMQNTNAINVACFNRKRTFCWFTYFQINAMWLVSFL